MRGSADAAAAGSTTSTRSTEWNRHMRTRCGTVSGRNGTSGRETVIESAVVEAASSIARLRAAGQTAENSGGSARRPRRRRSPRTTATSAHPNAARGDGSPRCRRRARDGSPRRRRRSRRSGGARTPARPRAAPIPIVGRNGAADSRGERSIARGRVHRHDGRHSLGVTSARGTSPRPGPARASGCRTCYRRAVSGLLVVLVSSPWPPSSRARSLAVGGAVVAGGARVPRRVSRNARAPNGDGPRVQHSRRAGRDPAARRPAASRVGVRRPGARPDAARASRRDGAGPLHERPAAADDDPLARRARAERDGRRARASRSRRSSPARPSSTSSRRRTPARSGSIRTCARASRSSAASSAC